MTDEEYMQAALDVAREAARIGEVPIGAVLADEQGNIIACAGNQMIGSHNPVGHAEIRALQQGAKFKENYRLPECTLFVTLEPCTMCAGAISLARIKRLVIAASDPKGGAVWHGVKFFEQATCHWRPTVEQGPFAEEAGELLRTFFKARR